MPVTRPNYRYSTPERKSGREEYDTLRKRFFAAYDDEFASECTPADLMTTHAATEILCRQHGSTEFS